MKEIYQKRRTTLISSLKSEDVAILCSAPETFRSHDVKYPYRQNNYFYYLTGFKEPNSILVLIPGHQTEKVVLFNRPLDPKEERWTGKRLGVDAACDLLGVDVAYPIETFSEKIPFLLSDSQRVFVEFSERDTTNSVMQFINNAIERNRDDSSPPCTLYDIRPLLNEMRLTKSHDELNHMRRAANISAQAHMKAMCCCQPGMFEYELEAELLSHFCKNGARFPAYESIVAGGANACVLHYVQNNARLNDGELVLIDAGAEYEYYAADITRTFPINGEFTKPQAALYDCVLAAQEAAIASVKPGITWSSLQDIILDHLVSGLLALGILKGSKAELIETKAYQPFYMHNSGHFLGMDVHDVGLYQLNGQSRPLEENWVFTIEPGLYIDADCELVDKQWRGIGIRIEDDVRVVKTGREVLSEAAPKRRLEIEELMR